MKITCTLLSYPQHHFHATRFHVGFFPEHIDDKIKRGQEHLEIFSQLHDPMDEVLKFI